MNKTKGSGLIFAVILLFVILAMVVTLSSVTILETKMNQKTKSSVGAFYNSESGVEWALNKVASSSGTINSSTAFGTPATDGSYNCPAGFGCKVYLLDEKGKIISDSNPDVTPDDDISEVKAVRSVGTQGIGDSTQRAIEAVVAADPIGKYQYSCAVYSGNGAGTLCCRIETDTGITACKQSVNGGLWADWPGGAPWTTGATGSVGKYNIHCGYSGNAAGTLCCRVTTDNGTGSTACKQSVNGGLWADWPGGAPW